jgi:septal ring factor EnvC (AmiA/AmiB activator)
MHDTPRISGIRREGAHMAAWLPLFKASLPYITQIVSAALPAFTAKSGGDKQDETTAQQIAELQTAVTHNTEYLKTLARQLQDTIESVDAAAIRLQDELKFLRRIVASCAVLAATSLAVAIWALLK